MIAHLGLVSVLPETNGEPWQIFIVLLMAVSVLSVVMWQYLAGQRSGFWSERARRQWRIAGRVFGSLIGMALALSILAFHVQKKPIPLRAGQAAGSQPATRFDSK